MTDREKIIESLNKDVEKAIKPILKKYENKFSKNYFDGLLYIAVKKVIKMEV